VKVVSHIPVRGGAFDLTLAPLRACLHQDVLVVHGSLEGAIGAFARSLPSTKKTVLLEAIDLALRDKSNAELKGVLKRVGCGLEMNGKTSRQFFEAVRSALASKAGA
jgi:hypothetical protein